MKDITISLIIPAYNEEKRIGICLDSVIKFAGDKLHEIIVVNNKSTDNTKSIASSYSKVKVVDEPQKGVMHARSRGIESSTGDIVAFMDADCIMVEGWFEKVALEFNKNKNTALLSGPYFYYDAPLWLKILTEIYFLVALIIYRAIGYMAIFGNMAIRRSTLDKMNGLDTNIDFYGDDTDTARRASRFGKVKFDYNLRLQSSCRRLRDQGVIKTGFIYILNFFSEVTFHKPLSKRSEDFR